MRMSKKEAEDTYKKGIKRARKKGGEGIASLACEESFIELIAFGEEIMSKKNER